MNKTQINIIIKNMEKAGIVTKTTPWLIEGIGERKADVRYVGIRPFDDWLAIFSEDNNLLLKCILEKKSAGMEVYLANKPPFIKFFYVKISEDTKWESTLGAIRARLQQDKEDVIRHSDKAGNLFLLVQPHVR